MSGVPLLDFRPFLRHIRAIYRTWKSNEEWASIGCLSVAHGKNVDGENERASIVHLWLLGYQIPDTIFLFTPTALHCFCSEKKVKILRALADKLAVAIAAKGDDVADLPENFALNFITCPARGAKAEEVVAALQPLVKEAKAATPKGKTVGYFAKDKMSGEIIPPWMPLLKDLESADVSSVFNRSLLLVKDKQELDCVRTSASITASVMKKHLIAAVETIVDEDSKVTHRKISDDIEQVFGDVKKNISVKLKQEYVDVESVVVQSGTSYNLTVNAESNDEKLNIKTPILIVLAATYRSYTTMVSRVLFIDPTAKQEKLYTLLLKAQQACIDLVKEGNTLGEAYDAARSVLEKGGVDGKHILSNAGFGMGIEFPEKELVIKSNATKKFTRGHVFSVRVGLKNIPSEATTDDTYSMMVADTVMVSLADGNPVLLSKTVSKSLDDISYSLEGSDDEDEEMDDEEAEDRDAKLKARAAETGISARERAKREKEREAARLRQAEEARKKHQAELGKMKQHNLDQNLKSNGANGSAAPSANARKKAYSSVAGIPRDISGLQIVVDPKAEAVLFPIYGVMTPFGILQIKSVSKTEDNYIRVVFHAPTGGNTNLVSKNIPATVTNNPDKIFVKELVYHCPDTRNLQQIYFKINEMKKRVISRESQKRVEASIVEQDRLILSKRKGPALSSLYIRPAITGRQSTGTVEAHHNGFRFTAVKGTIVDILYNNIKHAFFQPADNEVVVLIHLHLRHEILVGKKKTKDIQFYAETMEASQSLDHRRSSMYDADEIEAEQKERQWKQQLNNTFNTFVKKVEGLQNTKIEFDIPFRELGFYGVPMKSRVFVQPTVNCLVHLVQSPWFILSLEDVEVANFERVMFHLRYFDIVFVLKDYSKKVVRVDQIPMEMLDQIKEWLDSCDIKYYENQKVLNWQRIMTTIREDIQGFADGGGWGFLEDEVAADGDDEESDAGDEDFQAGSDSDDDDDDDESDAEISEESDEDEYSDGENDSGEDWEELERRAKESDSRKHSFDEGDDRDHKRRRR
eukprot:TRINITY_DN1213_c4_g1_i1.p1 TRINITY_DN1213_c4_g1~~TRINITY_DN1213_c4_g1_i1.p1  ORF type:complete len:1033 (-),score=352.69 TRINITY_DN1213_c4_g1_i1:121-3219(-)